MLAECVSNQKEEKDRKKRFIRIDRLSVPMHDLNPDKIKLKNIYRLLLLEFLFILLYNGSSINHVKSIKGGGGGC